MQPLSVPTSLFTDITMDFLESLPSSRGHTAIFIVVDRLSKFAHFIGFSHPLSAKTVAQAFFDKVFKLHGLPHTITSDRDTLFLSVFWKELFALQGVQL